MENYNAALIAKRTIFAAEAACILGCSVQSVYNMIHTKQLTAFKIGRSWKIPVEAIDEFVRICCK